MKKNKLIYAGLIVVLLFTFLSGCEKEDGEMTYEEYLDAHPYVEIADDSCSSALIAPPIYAVRKAGAPVLEEHQFNKGDFHLCVRVKTITPKAPGAAVIMIDDVIVAKTSDFNANFEQLVRRIANTDIGPGEHTLKVKMMGKPDTALQILLGVSGRKLTADDGYSREEIYVNSQKARLLREEERPLLFQISMKRYLTPTELYELLEDSGGAELMRVVFKVFDNEGDFCSLPRDFRGNEKLLRSKEFLWDMFDNGYPSHTQCAQDIMAALQHDLDSGHITTPILEVTGTPRMMYEFWEKYPDEIRVIQTIAHDIEKAQNSYWPDREI